MVKYSKEFKIDFEKAQFNYIKAKIMNDNIEKVSNECKQKVLNENVFLEEDTQERILKPNSDFMMSDPDFEKYCKLVCGEEIKRGLEVPTYDTTADYKTKPILIKAENELIKLGTEIYKEDLFKKGFTETDLQRTENKFRDKLLEIFVNSKLL